MQTSRSISCCSTLFQEPHNANKLSSFHTYSVTHSCSLCSCEFNDTWSRAQLIATEVELIVFNDVITMI